jgi:DNA-binding IclR family transcriptional regulator
MVNSVQRAAAILDLLGREKRLGLSQVAKRLRIPKSTAHSIIETLVREGLVARDAPTGTFGLGIRLLELGQAAQENFELRRVASPRLLALNREVDETVHLTVLDGDVVLYVECFESSKRLRTYSVIGVRAPLHCTAVGKAILLPRRRRADPPGQPAPARAVHRAHDHRPGRPARAPARGPDPGLVDRRRGARGGGALRRCARVR